MQLSRIYTGLVYLALVIIIGVTTACRHTGLVKIADYDALSPTLPSELSLVVWNAQKGNNPLIAAELQTMLAREAPDLVLLQEAKADLLETPPIGGHFARSWHYPWPGGETIGVMTLSKVVPLRLQPVQSRYREFSITAPKTSLISEYRLENGQILMAVNLHLLTFERWSTRKMAHQLQALQQRMADHQGPLIMAGDFNTWSYKRLSLVESVASALNLREVKQFGPGRRTADTQQPWLNEMFGINDKLPLDRVYVRGMTPVIAAVLNYRSSDHRPLKVRLALD